jgi:hypothetical protein
MYTWHLCSHPRGIPTIHLSKNFTSFGGKSYSDSSSFSTRFAKIFSSLRVEQVIYIIRWLTTLGSLHTPDFFVATCVTRVIRFDSVSRIGSRIISFGVALSTLLFEDFFSVSSRQQPTNSRRRFHLPGKGPRSIVGQTIFTCKGRATFVAGDTDCPTAAVKSPRPVVAVGW